MRNKKGFTLIELIVVLAILAIVAAIAVPTAFGSIEKAQIAADKASIDSMNSAIRTQAALNKLDSTSKTTVEQALTSSGIDLAAAPSNAKTSVIVKTGSGTETEPVVLVYKEGSAGTSWSATITSATLALDILGRKSS